jgi:hypothetical protein
VAGVRRALGGRGRAGTEGGGEGAGGRAGSEKRGGKRGGRRRRRVSWKPAPTVSESFARTASGQCAEAPLGLGQKEMAKFRQSMNPK